MVPMSLSPSIPPPPALDSPFTCLSHHPAFATRGRHCPHRRASPAPCAAVGGAAGGDCGPVGARDPRPDPRDPRLRRPRHRQPLGHPQPTHTQTRTRPDARTLTSEPTASPRRAPRPPAPLGCRPAASQPPAAGRPCPSAHPPPPVPLPHLFLLSSALRPTRPASCVRAARASAEQGLPGASGGAACSAGRRQLLAVPRRRPAQAAGREGAERAGARPPFTVRRPSWPRDDSLASAGRRRRATAAARHAVGIRMLVQWRALVPGPGAGVSHR